MDEISRNTLSISDTNKDSKKVSMWKRNQSTLATICSVILAIVIGIILRQTTGAWKPRYIMYLEFPGTLFLRALSGLILPIIISSLISSVGRLDVSLSGRIGLRAVLYYISTTLLAVFLGIVLVLNVKPGVGQEEGEKRNVTVRQTTTVDTMLDLFRNLVPSNLVQACFAQYSTSLIPPSARPNETNIYEWDIKGEYRSGTNILGLIAFSLIFGAILGRNGDKAKPLLDVITTFNELIMQLTALLIKCTPVGVLFLIMPRILGVEKVSTFLGGVGWYTLTVLVGLLIHGFIVLPLIYFITTRRNPFVFIVKMSEALLTAFGTASSSATLPVTMGCLQNKLQTDERVVNVLIPIGATINMDGTALYEAVAAIFIAQMRQRSLGLADVIIVSLTATAASIGAAGIPQAGLVTMVMVLNAVNLPPDDVSLIFVVDWLLDRFRTMVNVLGDSFGAAIVEHLSEKDLEKATKSQMSSPTNIEITKH
ncbi:excitatory amino acid transporter 3-like protein [Dinothrombium tinctorium]|uniref:Amino acid transporter n=1 Tax=Dinothrombium tinctorium TaxID=1965070 RepID=A0A3S3QA03_9ACAR|nr:excitatory amino acid transporter 3-like protein [Dinothrombium tinctorium]RWS06061.1 excitatory amino acid transporter 3-like protein [Dinothrombium tinctorium]RWS08166.1 excitatory amino acid transporter 3-like protein [Dinothrombium tinctorium]